MKVIQNSEMQHSDASDSSESVADNLTHYLRKKGKYEYKCGIS